LQCLSVETMKNGGKIGTLLAAFEDNIAKNNEYQHEGKSFLTTIACNKPVSKYRVTSSNNKKVERIEDVAARHRYDSRIAKYISDLHYVATEGKNDLSTKTTVLKSKEFSDVSSTAATVSDEESTLSCVQVLQQSHKKRSLRKIKVVCSSLNKKEELLDICNKSLKMVIEKSSMENRRPSLRSTSSKNSLDKIAATIKRVNSSNSLREAAQAASKSPKSTSSNLSASKKDKIRKRLSDHVNQSPTRDRRVYEKSITSMPVTTCVTNSAGQESFSSSPVALLSTPSSKRIAVAARRSSIRRKNTTSEIPSIPIVETANLTADSTLQALYEYGSLENFQQRKENGTVAVTTLEMMRLVNGPQEMDHKPIASIDFFAKRTDNEQMGMDMEYGPQEMDCESIDRSESLPKRTGSIARAARRSSVELCGDWKVENYKTHNIDGKPMRRFESLLNQTDSVSTALMTKEGEGASMEIVQEVDMEYGPQEMDRGPINRSELLPKRTGSIARAARRSSVELCEKVETYETHSVSGITTISDDSTMAKTPDTMTSSSSKVQTLGPSSSFTIPVEQASRRNSNSQCSIDMEYESHDMENKDSNHFSQSSTKIELTQKLEQLNCDDTENSETMDFGSISTGQISDNFVSKRKPPSSFSSSISLFTLDINRCRKTPKARGSSCGCEDDAQSFSTKGTAPAIVLPRRDEVVGILRSKPTFLNTTRHVQFADQQPGGGRRMCLDSSYKNDSLPVRPRRSNNFHLDRLKDSRSSQFASQPREPLHFMSIMAATRIQAVVRCWIQWKSTRVGLLIRKLIRIEENRKRDITNIQQEKWKFFENIQFEIVEREKRLEAQVSLGEKLSDHLKRDSALVRDQTKKLQEYSQNLRRNNDHLDQSIRLYHENFATINVMIELLRDKSDVLLASSKKYASRIDKLQEKLEYTSKQVEVEFHDKVRKRKTIRAILRLLRKRSSVADSPLVNSLFQIANGVGGVDKSRRNNRIVSLDTFATNDFGKNAFDLVLNPHDNDMMSVYSGITDFSNGNGSERWDKQQQNEKCSLHLNDPSRSDITFKFEVLNNSKGKSSGNSFASYGDGRNPSMSHPNKPANDSNSINGNSFASYSGSTLAKGEVSTKTASRNSTVAAPPRRRVSYHREDSADLTIADFDTITEEVSLSDEESIDS
jgi:hypothetical protein